MGPEVGPQLRKGGGPPISIEYTSLEQNRPLTASARVRIVTTIGVSAPIVAPRNTWKGTFPTNETG